MNDDIHTQQQVCYSARMVSSPTKDDIQKSPDQAEHSPDVHRL